MSTLENTESIAIPANPVQIPEQTFNLWFDYWNYDDFWNQTSLWKINAALAYLGLKKLSPLNKMDNVLNIGCGAGYFERLLSKDVQRIVSCDVSENFVRIAKSNCQGRENVDIRQMGEDYTHLESFGGPYSFILCNSVVQYYQSPAEILELVKSARNVAAQGGRMLIADLPRKRSLTGTCWDWFCSLVLSIPGRYFIEFLEVTGQWVKKGFIYRMYNRAQKSLQFTDPEIQNLVKEIQDLGLKVSLIKKSVSCYANRPSLLIYF